MDRKSKKALLKRYYEYLKGREYTQKTIEEYMSYVDRFLQYLIYCHLGLGEVDHKVAEGFRKKIKGGQAQRIMRAALRSFYNYRFVTFRDPKPDFEIQLPRMKYTLPPVPDIKYLEKMREVTHKINHRFAAAKRGAILELLLATAIREKELIAMRRRDINFTTERIKIRGKGRREREVFLTPSTIKALKEYLKFHEKKTNFLFYARGSHRPMKHASLVHIFRSLKKLAGVPKDVSITCHSIRRLVASEMAKNNIKIYVIQQLLGHSNPITTARYIRLDTSIAEQEIKAHHPFELSKEKK